MNIFARHRSVKVFLILLGVAAALAVAPFVAKIAPMKNATRTRISETCAHFPVGSQVSSFTAELMGAGATKFALREQDPKKHIELGSFELRTPGNWDVFQRTAGALTQGHITAWTEHWPRMIVTCTVLVSSGVVQRNELEDFDRPLEMDFWNFLGSVSRMAGFDRRDSLARKWILGIEGPKNLNP